jgi:hypothetical protein
MVHLFKYVGAGAVLIAAVNGASIPVEDDCPPEDLTTTYTSHYPQTTTVYPTSTEDDCVSDRSTCCKHTGS